MIDTWNSEKSKELYSVSRWAEGYFDINDKGNLVVKPDRSERELDVSEFVSSLVSRGIEPPVLLRFNGIIADRVKRLNEAFNNAITEYGYSGKYQAVYPVKVNQQRHVVDSVRKAGRPYNLGLEVGSKPELVATLAIHDDPNALLLCNGYKDREYIELALLASKIGRRTIIIVEQLEELKQIKQISAQIGVEAEIGIRIKPSLKGSGHWQSSGGDLAKFGLSTPEIIEAIEILRKDEKQDWLKLLHFHVGSQITSIGSIKKVLREATRMYTELKKLCPSLSIFDVGGGLAVDYDGSKTNFRSSMNYSLEEYARDVVDAIALACKEAQVDTPDIVSESGRAMVAHHSLLITEAVNVAPTCEPLAKVPSPPTNHSVLEEFYELISELSVKNCQETFNDAISLREQVLDRFIQGDLSLAERAYADTVYWQLLAKIKKVASGLKYLPEDLQELDNKLRDIYFCSFSVFQSLPDSWAIGQLFPVMPIQNLCSEPKRRAILTDMSCDSDGKIDKFIDVKDVRQFVNLHTPDPDHPYYIGIFLVGAYQEILGDLHNLFGDTNVVHVNIDESGHPELIHVVEGDSVREVLGYVQYEPADLVERLRVAMELALKHDRISTSESARLQKRFRQALEGYTYYQRDIDSQRHYENGIS